MLSKNLVPYGELTPPNTRRDSNLHVTCDVTRSTLQSYSPSRYFFPWPPRNNLKVGQEKSQMPPINTPVGISRRGCSLPVIIASSHVGFFIRLWCANFIAVLLLLMLLLGVRRARRSRYVVSEYHLYQHCLLMRATHIDRPREKTSRRRTYRNCSKNGRNGHTRYKVQ